MTRYASHARRHPRHAPVSAQGGFTLIELMIAVAVIAILASIAVPSYRGYVERATRTDAHAGLMEAAGQLERCYTVNNSYANCNVITNSPTEITASAWRVRPRPIPSRQRLTVAAAPMAAPAP